MLILVGVTINVALNGGLFTQAQDAASDTQKAAEREQLLSAVVTAYDTKTGLISQSKLESNLGTDWRVDGTEGGPYTVTSPKGNVFTVDANGNISDETGNGGTPEGTLPEELAKYLLGQDLNGRNITDIVYNFGDISMKFIDDDTTPDFNEEELGVEFLTFNKNYQTFEELYSNMYIKYNNRAYKVNMEVNLTEGKIETQKDGLKLAYAPKGTEGEKYTLNGEEWTILYDEGDYIEIISPKTVGQLYLDFSNKNIDWNLEKIKQEADIDGTEGLSDAEKNIYVYNNAIDIINQYCKEQVDDSVANDKNVRSVGGTEETDEWYYNDSITSSIYNGKGKAGDEFYLNDYLRMSILDASDCGGSYWVASRHVLANDFWVRSGSNMSSSSIWGIESDGRCSYARNIKAVRPIIKIKK